MSTTACARIVLMLYHIANARAWERSGEQYTAESLQREGFIHPSYGYQRRLTQQRYYLDQEGLVLLAIDPLQLSAPVRLENGFPDLYGALPTAAVVSVSPLPVYRDIRVALLSATYLAPSHALEQELSAISADLVVLRELPLNPWSPASLEPREDDVDDWRSPSLSRAAATSRKTVLGGVLSAPPQDVATQLTSGGPTGTPACATRSSICHEPGFWETQPYRPGTLAPEVSDHLGFPLGIQLCSDTNRPFGSMALQAQGASASMIPRATEKGTYHRWRRICQALTSVR